MRTERPEPKEKDKKAAKRRLQFSVWYIFLAVLAVVLFQSYMTSVTEEKNYSEVKDWIREGKVEYVEVSSDAITGELKEGAVEKGKPRKFRAEIGGLEDPKLIEELETAKREHGLKHYKGETGSAVLEVLLTWVPLLLLMGAIWFFLFRRIGQERETVLSLGKSRAKIYAETDIKTTFVDVAGVDESVDEVKEVVEFLRNPEKFRRLGGQIPKGILLVGLPGTGKTLLARALAGEARVPFFHLSGSDFVEMFAGLGAARVRDLFKQAKEKAPCIIFIDELDALGRSRSVGALGGHEEREQTLNQLLVEMDGFEPNAGVVLLAATNRPELLDPALLRPGRFDRQVVVDRPDQKGRLAILMVHSKNKKYAPDVDLETVAKRTVGMVGADLANVLNEAALLAGRKEKDGISRADIEEAIDRVMAGLEKKKRLLSPKEKEIVAYHESGHAILAEVLPGADKVHKVSIVPRGIAALGMTIHLPTEDRYLVTKGELEDRLAVMLGGRSAEELVFDQVSTGAQNDLEVATDFARRMVVEYGMSDRIGLVSFDGAGRRPRFLMAPDMLGERRYSEETAREIDLEVKRILDEAHARAKAVLMANRPELESLAKKLLDIEVVGREELDLLLADLKSRLRGEPAPENRKT